MNVCILSAYENKAKKLYLDLKAFSEKREFELVIRPQIFHFEKPDFEIIIVVCEKNSRRALEYYHSLGPAAKTSKWIFVSDNFSYDDRQEMLKTGNISFFFYDSPVNLLMSIIDRPLEKGQFFDPGFNGKRILNPAEDLYKAYHISQKEYNVICGLIDGKNAKEIGQKLNISDKTVETHRKNIYKKIGIHKVIDLVNIINELES